MGMTYNARWESFPSKFLDDVARKDEGTEPAHTDAPEDEVPVLEQGSLLEIAQYLQTERIALLRGICHCQQQSCTLPFLS